MPRPRPPVALILCTRVCDSRCYNILQPPKPGPVIALARTHVGMNCTGPTPQWPHKFVRSAAALNDLNLA